MKKKQKGIKRILKMSKGLIEFWKSPLGKKIERLYEEHEMKLTANEKRFKGLGEVLLFCATKVRGKGKTCIRCRYQSGCQPLARVLEKVMKEDEKENAGS